MSQIDRSLAEAARAWPFEEARKLVARTGGKAPAKGYVLFETGYGPSGLPHIGTFGEVVRTTMVRQAFQRLSDVPTRLFCFSDDMDGLRKVPDNVPNKEMLAAASRQAADRGARSVQQRASVVRRGQQRAAARVPRFVRLRVRVPVGDRMVQVGPLRQDAARHAAALRRGAGGDAADPRRRSGSATYSIFLPISPKTGRVLQVPVIQTNVDAGTIVYRDEDGALVETPVTGGNVKLQWKADWAGRWFALESTTRCTARTSSRRPSSAPRSCKILGGRPPEGFNYELFLDEEGKKISKSKGNGLSVEEWLRYAPPEVARALHVPGAAARQAALLRRDPARDRRLSRRGRAAAGRGAGEAARQSGVAHPRRRGGRPSRGRRQLRHAAQPRERGAHRRQGRAVAVPAPLRAGRDAGERALSRPAADRARSPTTRTS